MERTITEVTRSVYERVMCRINRDTGEVQHIHKVPRLAMYTVAYTTPTKKGKRGNMFTCRAENEADAVAQAHENFARIDAGIHLRDVYKQGASK
jgi:hypothetical protein